MDDMAKIQKLAEEHLYFRVSSKGNKGVKVAGNKAKLDQLAKKLVKDPSYVYIPRLRIAGSRADVASYLSKLGSADEINNFINTSSYNGSNVGSAEVANEIALAHAYYAAHKNDVKPKSTTYHSMFDNYALTSAFLGQVHSKNSNGKKVLTKDMFEVKKSDGTSKKNGVSIPKVYSTLNSIISQIIGGVQVVKGPKGDHMKVIDISKYGHPEGTQKTKNKVPPKTGYASKWLRIENGKIPSTVVGVAGLFSFVDAAGVVHTGYFPVMINRKLVDWDKKLATFISEYISSGFAIQGINLSEVVNTAIANTNSSEMQTIIRTALNLAPVSQVNQMTTPTAFAARQ